MGYYILESQASLLNVWTRKPDFYRASGVSMYLNALGEMPLTTQYS